MEIRLKKRLFPFIREIIIITIVTTSTNPLKTLGKKRDRRWNETTAKGEKKGREEKARKPKAEEGKRRRKKRGEEKRSGSPAKRRYGCNIKYQQYCLVASVLWHLKNKTRTPVSAASPPPRLPPPRSTPAAESLLEFKMAGSGCTVRGQPSFPPHVRLLPAGTFLFLRVGISPPLPDPRIRLSS